MYLTPAELSKKPEAFRKGYRDGLNNVTHEDDGPFPLAPDYTHYWDGYQAAQESEWKAPSPHQYGGPNT